jgi:hypothetical protein
MKFAILMSLLASQVAVAAIMPPKDVQTLVVPILDLRAQAESSQGEAQQSAFTKSERLTAQLFQVKTRASDEALVTLMNFYVGESLQSDLVHEVTKRGKRMLPFLLKYQNKRVLFSRRKYPASLLVASDIRTRDFQTAIEAIKAGKVLGED